MERKSHICGNCENANWPSLCAACANRNLQEKYELVNAAKRHRDLLQKRLEERLKANREIADQQHWLLIHHQKIAQLKETLRLKQNQLHEEKSKLREKTNELNTRKNSLAEAYGVLKKNKTKELKLHSDEICSLNSRLTAVEAELLQNQSVAIKQLCKIFPVGRGHKREDGKQGDKGYYYDQICNVPLPRGLNPNSVTPLQLAVSLGYMLQLLNLVARYLYAPLLLDSGFAGSCSRVWERAPHSDSQMKKVYPLFFPMKMNSTVARKQCLTAFDVASLLDFDLQKGVVKDVQKGILLLKRAVACVTTYYFNLFSIPLPIDISTFEGFQKILKFISSREKDAATFLKETRFRCRRRQELLLESSDPGTSSSSLQESEQRKDQMLTVVGRGVGPSSKKMSDMRRAKDDGREVVRDLPLLPPPSHSEDAE